MAKALLESLLPASLKVESAGTDALPGQPPTLQTLRLLEERRISAPNHKAQKISAELVNNADMIFVMEDYHRKKILKKFPASASRISMMLDFHPSLAKWIKEMGIPDPQGMPQEFYENIYGLIEHSCLGFSQFLRNPPQVIAG